MEPMDAHHRDQAGRTPLHYAAVDNKLDDVNALIAAGAEIDAREDTGQYTPLMFAAQNDDNIEVVKVLVEAGADVNLTNRKGETPLFIATASPAYNGTRGRRNHPLPSRSRRRSVYRKRERQHPDFFCQAS
jgi:uncharacterized protein